MRPTSLIATNKHQQNSSCLDDTPLRVKRTIRSYFGLQPIHSHEKCHIEGFIPLPIYPIGPPPTLSHRIPSHEPPRIIIPKTLPLTLLHNPMVMIPLDMTPLLPVKYTVSAKEIIQLKHDSKQELVSKHCQERTHIKRLARDIKKIILERRSLNQMTINDKKLKNGDTTTTIMCSCCTPTSFKFEEEKYPFKKDISSLDTQVTLKRIQSCPENSLCSTRRCSSSVSSSCSNSENDNDNNMNDDDECESFELINSKFQTPQQLCERKLKQNLDSKQKDNDYNINNNNNNKFLCDDDDDNSKKLDVKAYKKEASENISSNNIEQQLNPQRIFKKKDNFLIGRKIQELVDCEAELMAQQRRNALLCSNPKNLKYPMISQLYHKCCSSTNHQQSHKYLQPVVRAVPLSKSTTQLQHQVVSKITQQRLCHVPYTKTKTSSKIFLNQSLTNVPNSKLHYTHLKNGEPSSSYAPKRYLPTKVYSMIKHKQLKNKSGPT